MTCRRKAMEFYAVTRKAVHLCAQSTQRVNWRITISKLPDFSGWNIPIDPVNRIDKWSIVVSKVDEQPENPSRMWFRLLQDPVSRINTHRKPLRDILEVCFALESVAKGSKTPWNQWQVDVKCKWQSLSIHVSMVFHLRVLTIFQSLWGFQIFGFGVLSNLGILFHPKGFKPSFSPKCQK